MIEASHSGCLRTILPDMSMHTCDSQLVYLIVKYKYSLHNGAFSELSFNRTFDVAATRAIVSTCICQLIGINETSCYLGFCIVITTALNH